MVIGAAGGAVVDDHLLQGGHKVLQQQLPLLLHEGAGLRQALGGHRIAEDGLLEVAAVAMQHVGHRRGQVVAGIGRQEAEEARLVFVGRDAVCQQLDRFAVIGEPCQAAAQQLVKQAAGMDMARDRCRQGLEAGGFALARQLARAAVAVAQLGVGKPARDELGGRCRPLHGARRHRVADARDLTAVQPGGHRHLADVTGVGRALVASRLARRCHVSALEEFLGLCEGQAAPDGQARQRQQQILHCML